MERGALHEKPDLSGLPWTLDTLPVIDDAICSQKGV